MIAVDELARAITQQNKQQSMYLWEGEWNGVLGAQSNQKNLSLGPVSHLGLSLWMWKAHISLAWCDIIFSYPDTEELKSPFLESLFLPPPSMQAGFEIQRWISSELISLSASLIFPLSHPERQKGIASEVLLGGSHRDSCSGCRLNKGKKKKKKERKRL